MMGGKDKEVFVGHGVSKKRTALKRAAVKKIFEPIVRRTILHNMFIFKICDRFIIH